MLPRTQVTDPASRAYVTALAKWEEVLLRRVPRPFRKPLTEEERIEMSAALLLAIETVVEHHP